MGQFKCNFNNATKMFSKHFILHHFLTAANQAGQTEKAEKKLTFTYFQIDEIG